MAKIKQVNLIDQKLLQKKKNLNWLSQKTGLSYSHLSKIKKNKVIPTIPTGQVIANALGFPIEEIFFYQED